MAVFDFTIEEGSDHSEFVSKIIKQLNDGWKLHGDLKVFTQEKETSGKEVIWYVQALTKETIEKRKPGGVGLAFR